MLRPGHLLPALALAVAGAPSARAEDAEEELLPPAEDIELGGPRRVEEEVTHALMFRGLVGVATFHEPLHEVGLEVAIPLKGALLLDVGAGAWIGYAPDPGSAEPWTYALIPSHAGVGYRWLVSPAVQPYAGAALTALVYYTAPDLQGDAMSDLDLHMGPGLQLSGGVDLFPGEHLGFTAGAVGGLAWTRDIDALVAPRYHEGWYHLGLRVGAVVRL